MFSTQYMNTSAEVHALTNTLLSTIRLQRHLGARIIISTQEPTISTALLDLSSVTIVHRFTSPEWLRILKQHLAAAASGLVDQTPDLSDPRETESSDDGIQKRRGDTATKIFADIVKLRAGEALLISPSAIVGLERQLGGEVGLKRLGAEYLKVRVLWHPECVHVGSCEQKYHKACCYLVNTLIALFKDHLKEASANPHFSLNV
jgi:hypothetical protein